MNIKSSIFVLIIWSNLFLIAADKKVNEMVKSDIKGISGSIPIEMNRIIKKINVLPKDGEIKNGFLNRLILHGVPGNGKTTFAQKIAEATDSEFIQIKASSVITSYQGSGSIAIKEAFESAMNMKKRTVVFIDEIDAIATKAEISKSPMMIEHNATAKTLWLWLDDVKKNPKIFVIVATNKFAELERTFIARFGQNIIEIFNPNPEMRREVINFFIEKINTNFDPNFKLDAKAIDKLIEKTKDMSIRDIEYIVYIIQENPESTIDNIVTKYKATVNPSEINKKMSTADKINATHAVLHGTEVAIKISESKLPGFVSNLPGVPWLKNSVVNIYNKLPSSVVAKA